MEIVVGYLEKKYHRKLIIVYFKMFAYLEMKTHEKVVMCIFKVESLIY